MPEPKPKPKPPTWWSLLRDLPQQMRGLPELPPGAPNDFSISDILRGATGLGDQGPAGPTWTNAGALLAALPVGSLRGLKALAAGEHAAEEAVQGIRAYHGSPHDFPPVEGAPLGRFDPTKIGTGEGGQAFAYGHYSAEQEGVAQGYKRALGNRMFKVGDRELVSPMGGSTRALDTQTRGENIAAQALDDAINAQSSSPAQFAANYIRKAAREYPEDAAHIQEALDVIHEWQKTGEVQKMGGHMYELNINADPAHFLDWDAPIADQPAVVQELVAKRWKGNEAFAPRTGAELYRELGPDAVFASEWLKERGIPGVKYLDQGSRAAGEGTRNYVVFPGREDLIDILRKYGWLPPVAGLGYLSQVGQKPEAR